MNKIVRHLLVALMLTVGGSIVRAGPLEDATLRMREATTRPPCSFYARWPPRAVLKHNTNSA
jgi:hypothetical protein